MCIFHILLIYIDIIVLGTNSALSWLLICKAQAMRFWQLEALPGLFMI